MEMDVYFYEYTAATATATSQSLQSCLTLCNPVDGSPPGSPSLGFSRQEHWSRLPFPCPMHESEKWKGSRSVVSVSWRPHGLQPTRLLHPWDFPGKSTGVEYHCLLRAAVLGCLISPWTLWLIFEISWFLFFNFLILCLLTNPCVKGCLSVDHSQRSCSAPYENPNPEAGHLWKV